MENKKEKIFNTAYDIISKKYLEIYEESRKKRKHYWIIAIVLFVFTIIFFNLGVDTRDDYHTPQFGFDETTKIIFYIISVLFFLFSCIVAKLGDKEFKYHKNYKNTVIPEFLNNIDENLSYTPEINNFNEVSNEYLKTVSNSYEHRFWIDDNISGIINNDMKLDIYDLRDQVIIAKSDDRQNVTTLFNGLFAIIKLGKYKETHLKVLDKKSKPDIKYNFIKLDYEDFQNNFNVAAETNIQAYQLLTHDVMDLLLYYKNQYNITFDIDLLNDTLYCKFHTGPLFEAASNKSELDKDRFYKYFSSLNLVKELSKEIAKIYTNQEI